MIRSVPKLKILGIEFLKNSQIEYIAETLQSLQLLEYNEIEDAEFYDRLKISRDDDINKNIKVQKIEIGDKTIFSDDFWESLGDY